MKHLLINSILLTIAKAIEELSTKDQNIIEEMKDIPNNTIIELFVFPHLSMKVKKTADKFIHLHDNDQKPDLIIAIKNEASGLDILTGKISIDEGFCQNRFVIKGDVFLCVRFVRILYVIQAYLLPSCVANKILKQIPKLTLTKAKAYLLLID